MKRQIAAQRARELAETRVTLPVFDKLGDLFTDPEMFRSVDRYSAEGFAIVARNPAKMMCGRHKRVKGYVFKKFNDHFPKNQLVNYLRRIEGARLLRHFIEEHSFTRVTAPKKWLYQLPSDFPERYLLVAERLDLRTKEKSESRYARIDKKQLRELATILYYFRGLNSTLSNLPFTEDGKIAFIDTERWDHDKEFFEKVGDRIPRERKVLAKAVYKELKRSGARPFTSAF